MRSWRARPMPPMASTPTTNRSGTAADNLSPLATPSQPESRPRERRHRFRYECCHSEHGRPGSSFGRHSGPRDGTCHPPSRTPSTPGSALGAEAGFPSASSVPSDQGAGSSALHTPRSYQSNIARRQAERLRPVQPTHLEIERPSGRGSWVAGPAASWSDLRAGAAPK